jgi:hypothetical protein
MIGIRSDSPWKTAAISVLLLASTSGFTAPVVGQEAQPKASSFKATATRFVSQYCTKCHGAKRQKGDMRLDNIGHDMSDDKTARQWNDIFAQLQFREMPPPPTNPQQPTTPQKPPQNPNKPPNPPHLRILLLPPLFSRPLSKGRFF